VIIFQKLRTERICVQLQELTLGQAGALCREAPDRQELTTTSMLRAVASSAIAPTPRYVTDPLLWTVQERNYLLAMYLAQVMSDGPDFTIAGEAKLSHYLDYEADLRQTSTLVTTKGQPFTVYPLLGVHAQALETMVSNRGEWLLGAMACTVFAANEAPPDWGAMSESQVQAWIEAKTVAMDDRPESEAEAFYLAWEGGQQNLRHFFDLSFDDKGICFWPIKESEVGQLAPARFRAISAVSGVTKRLYGLAD